MNTGIVKDASFHFKVTDIAEGKKTSIDALFFNAYAGLTLCILNKAVTYLESENSIIQTAKNPSIGSISWGTLGQGLLKDNMCVGEMSQMVKFYGYNEDGKPYTNNMETVGIARLHPMDCCSYRVFTGMKIALGHAIRKAIPQSDTKIRKLIWDQFFSIAKRKFSDDDSFPKSIKK